MHFTICTVSVFRLREEKLNQFIKTAPEKCAVNLKLSLLTRDPATKLLSVNFDNNLVEVLREVHYLLMMSGQGICENPLPAEFEGVIAEPVDELKSKLPKESIAIFEQAEPFRVARLKLNQITDAYNTVRQITFTVEYPLISVEINDFDAAIAPAFNRMTWETGILIAVFFQFI